MSHGAKQIVQERQRHEWDEGWTDEHDDQHMKGEMALAAACYARHAAKVPFKPDIDAYRGTPPPDDWPWDAKWWKPKNPLRDLVRAGALIAADYDRIERRIANDYARAVADRDKPETGGG